ncbi:MAG: SdpI family protein [Spirochaetota bacterium]|jgi:uncharacterized membrane protein|nr:SdpI family protein [Spirochaetota bacterium]
MVLYLIGFCVVNLLVIAAGLPLAMRKVRPNPTYGVRNTKLLANENLWYTANAAAGRSLVAGGLISLLFTVFLFFQRNATEDSYPTAFAMAFGIIMIIVLLVVMIRVRRIIRRSVNQ